MILIPGCRFVSWEGAGARIRPAIIHQDPVWFARCETEPEELRVLVRNSFRLQRLERIQDSEMQ